MKQEPKIKSTTKIYAHVFWASTIVAIYASSIMPTSKTSLILAIALIPMIILFGTKSVKESHLKENSKKILLVLVYVVALEVLAAAILMQFI